MSQTNYDEIDLFQLFEVIWNGKWLISTFMAGSILVGVGFIFTQNKHYESKLIYSVDTVPPFYDEDKTLTDFRKKFYSVSVFEEWKESNSDKALVFEDFNANEAVDGFLFSKNEINRLAILKSEKKSGTFVLVKSNQLNLIDDFYDYAVHISGLLKKEYIVRAKEELKIIEARFNDLGIANVRVVDLVLSIDRYIVSAEKGAEVLSIQRPIIPEKVSPNSSLILASSAGLGGMISVFFILVRNAMTRRKEQLAKS